MILIFLVKVICWQLFAFLRLIICQTRNPYKRLHPNESIFIKRWALGTRVFDWLVKTFNYLHLNLYNLTFFFAEITEFYALLQTLKINLLTIRVERHSLDDQLGDK